MRIAYAVRKELRRQRKMRRRRRVDQAPSRGGADARPTDRRRESSRPMSRAFWFVAGAASGVYSLVKAKRTARELHPRRRRGSGRGVTVGRAAVHGRGRQWHGRPRGGAACAAEPGQAEDSRQLRDGGTATRELPGGSSRLPTREQLDCHVRRCRPASPTVPPERAAPHGHR